MRDLNKLSSQMLRRFYAKSWKASLMLFSTVLLVTATAPAARAQNVSDLRGIYVYSEHPENPSNFSQLQSALQVQGVDGLTALVGWQYIEFPFQQYSWGSANLLDELMGAAILNGKNVDLAIRAGQDTPCWLFSTGSTSCPIIYMPNGRAQPIELVVAEVHGANSNCNANAFAAPWDPGFLTQWDQMLGAVASHLQTTTYSNGPAWTLGWDALVAVRLTGINRSTNELRLPEEILAYTTQSPCGLDPYTNDLSIWLTEGYKPSLLLSGWEGVTASFQNHFPGKLFTLAIIPDDSGNHDYPFPEISENGCVYPLGSAHKKAFKQTPPVPTKYTFCSGPLPDDNAPLLSWASSQFPNLVVGYQSLIAGQQAEQYVAVTAPATWGTLPAYQTNDFNGPFQRASCATQPSLNAPVCPGWQEYLQLLEIGIFPTCISYWPNPIPASEPCRTNPRSQYIEVLPPDATAFPQAILQAHAELVDYTPPAITATAVPNVVHARKSSTVAVSGSITDDLSGVAPGTAQYSVTDSAGLTHLTGPITVNADGSYSFDVSLGGKPANRTYKISVSARDYAGNAGSAAAIVTEP